MRKINVEAIVEVLIPVKVKLNLLVRADEGANLERVLNKWAKGDMNADANMESITIQKIERIGESESEVDEGTLLEELEEHLCSCRCHKGCETKVLRYEVTDSR